MSKLIDLTGQKFGRLTVLNREQDYILPCGQHQALWKCKCDCGKICIIRGLSLRSNHTKSCGCFHDEASGDRTRTHGKSNERLYIIWRGMKRRCYNINNYDYKYYGGRGINICEEWKNNFKSFYDWSMSHGYREDLTIDRIDTNGNYEPSNCRWATMKEQSNNTRQNHMIEYNGKKQNMKQWAKELDIKYTTLATRININHCDINTAFETPVKNKTKGMMTY